MVSAPPDALLRRRRRPAAPGRLGPMSGERPAAPDAACAGKVTAVTTSAFGSISPLSTSE